MRNNSNENEFHLHENEPVGETQFHMNGLARRLVLKQRQRVTRKQPNVQYKCSLPSRPPTSLIIQLLSSESLMVSDTDAA